MTSSRERRMEHGLFLASVWIKGVSGIAEMIGGGLVLLVSPSFVQSVLVALTAPELAEDPDDLVANLLRHAAHGFSMNARAFASAYMLLHGLVRVLLVAGLLRRKLWAYPLTIWFLAAFIVYQGYRFSHTHSMWLVLLTVFDLGVAFLVWREYRSRRRVGFAVNG